TIRPVYNTTLSVSQVSVSGELSHFFAHNLTEFTIEQVSTYGYTLTRCCRLYSQHLGLDVGSVSGEVPGEVRRFDRSNVHEEFDTTGTALTTVCVRIDEARGIRDLRLYDLIDSGLFVSGYIQGNPVIEESQFQTNFSFDHAHRSEFVVRHRQTGNTADRLERTRRVGEEIAVYSIVQPVRVRSYVGIATHFSPRCSQLSIRKPGRKVRERFREDITDRY